MAKKLICMLIALVLVLSSSGVFSVHADVIDYTTSGDWEYGVDTKDNTAVVTKYNGTEAVVKIPKKLGGRTVGRIENEAFWYNKTITKLTIPEGVTWIGSGAFKNCSKLESVSFPNTLDVISNSSFENCVSLKSLVSPANLRVIDKYSFRGCTSLSSVTLGDKLEHIGVEAFYDCTALKQIVIPSSVRSIGNSALGQYSVGYSSKNTELVISGVSGSAAERYANMNKLPFVAIDDPNADNGENDDGELYVKLPDNSSIQVESGEEFTLVFYTAAMLPVGGVCASIDKDSRDIEILGGDICYSSEKDGSLMTGRLSVSKDYVDLLGIEPTVRDVSLFERFLKEYKINGRTKTLYVQPLFTVRMRITAPSGEFPVECYMMSAYDINGKMLKDVDSDFIDMNFDYGVVLIKDGDTFPFGSAEDTDGKRGDADGDGEVTILDATRIQRVLAGLAGKDEMNKYAADADGDGEVTILDATRIQRVLAGLCEMDGEQDKPTEQPTTEPTVQPDETMPKIKTVENGNSGVVIKWDPVKGAKAYRVFVKNGDSWKKLGDTTETSFTHSDAAYNTKYVYTVRCISKDGKTYTSDFDKKGYENTRLKKPILKSAKLMDGFIGVSWDKVAGAKAYRIYIKGGKYKSWTWIYDSDINYVDVDTDLAELESNKKYVFTVRCLNKLGGDRLMSGFDTSGVSVKYYDTPYIYSIENIGSMVDIYWTEVEGVAKYRVFEWKDGEWKKLTDTKTTGLRVTDLSLRHYCRYTVRGMDANGNYLTPYDYFGRKIFIEGMYYGQTPFSTKEIMATAEAHAKKLGFVIGADDDKLSDEMFVYMLDCTGFYAEDTTEWETLIGDRCCAMTDYYLEMLKRNGEKASYYDCSVIADGDTENNVWFYLVLTRLKSAK